jgi:protein-tyrosine phosphatase
MPKLLFVCTGNICRSPTAEGVLRHYVHKQGLSNEILLDSAGTQGYHIGAAPDPRSVDAAAQRGFDISALRARRLEAGDFQEFDLILGLDNSHMQHLQEIAPKNAKAELALFLEYAGVTKEKEVPDPYYGNRKHFEYVLDLVEAAALPLIHKIKQEV